MSCAESETKEAVLAKLYKEIERKVASELDNKLTALASRKCTKSDALIASLHLESLENELYEKYKNIVESGDEANFTAEVFFANYDFDDYETMIESISNDKSAPVKLRALHKLLDSQVIDVSHKRWHRLAKNLQHCLISTNDEVFTASLKMHYKIISLPASSCEGFSSLVQGLEMIFNNRCFLNKQHFDANNKLQNRAIQIVKVLLKTENFVLRNLVQAKLNLFDEVLVVLFMLIGRGQESSTLFEILSVLDKKAAWFSCLCYSLQTRNIVLKKCGNVVKIAVALLTGPTNKIMIKSSSKYKTDVCKLCHSIQIIIEVLKYERGQALFPVKLSPSNSFTVNQLLLAALTRVNETQTRNEMRKYYITLIENLTQYFESDTLNALIEPFTISTFDLKECYRAVSENAHVIRILNSLCSKKCVNLLYGYHKNKSSKHKLLHSLSSASPLQIISDLAIACIRHFISICEQEHQVKENLIELLHCCKLLYAVHPVSFLVCCPNKLVCCIKDFHDTIANYNVNLHYKLDLANILSFFFVRCPSTLKVLTGKVVLVNEIINCASDQFFLLIPAIASDAEGAEALTNNATKLLRPYLENIWMEEDDMWQESFEKALDSFLRLVQGIALSFRAFEVFATSESEATLVGCDAKPTTLAELLGCALDRGEEDFCASYVGLRTLELLLGNPDIAAYLEAAYNLTESLNNAQEKCVDTANTFNSTPLIVDELSSLRLSLIRFLNFNSAEVVRDSSALTRRNRLCELQLFLNKTRNGIHDNNWIFQARRAYRHTVEGIYNVHVLFELTEHMERYRKTTNFWREADDAELRDVSPEESVAIKQVIKLGISLGLLSFSAQCEEHLGSLLQKFYASLNVENEGFSGFPWILGVVFVMCSGNTEKTKKVIVALMHRYLPIFWPTGPKDDNFAEYFYRQLSVCLEDNYSEINNVFKTVGISGEAIARKWLQQCFFNILEMEEICNFLMLSLLFPVEYTVAFVVAMFQHFKPHLFEMVQNSQLHKMLDSTPFLDFHLSKHLPLMDNLSKQYKTFLCY